MAQLPAHIERTIERIIKQHIRPGATTRGAITNLVLSELDGHKGQLPHAALRCALRKLVFDRVKSVTQRDLPENVTSGLLRKVPENLRAIIGGLPWFITVGEGRDAPIVSTIHAQPQDWAASAVLKTKKMKQTGRSRDHDRDVLRMLETLGAKSLAELLRTEAPV